MSLLESAIVTDEVEPGVLVTDDTVWAKANVEAIDDAVEIDGNYYRPHINGGGLVAVTAYVAASAYVESTAMVKDNAVVLDAVRIRHRAIAEHFARISGQCELMHDSRVSGFAMLSGKVALQRRSRVSGHARVEGSVRLDYQAHVTRGHIIGSFLIE